MSDTEAFEQQALASLKLPGLGKTSLAMLEEAGILCAGDLLAFLPRAYLNQGDTTTADTWTCRALAFADAGQRNNPDYAGYPFIQAQAAARYGCKDQAFDYLEQALSGNPHCFGDLKHHWLFAHYQADPRMQDLEKRFPDQSASWRFEEL